MNFDIPVGLTDLLQDFTVAVLRQRPSDLYRFAADYFGEEYGRRRAAEDGADDDDPLGLLGAGAAGRKGVSFGGAHENNIDGGCGSDEDDDDEPMGTSIIVLKINLF